MLKWQESCIRFGYSEILTRFMLLEKIQRNEVHLCILKSVGSDTGKMLTTIVPAGFENFFIDAGKPISDDSFSPPLENIDIREIINLLKERYDIEMFA